MMINVKAIIDTIGSLGSLVALKTLIYQVKKDRKERLFEQASKVSCWLVDLTCENDQADSFEIIHISNVSNQPIYDVVFSIDPVLEKSTMIQTGYDACTFVRCIPSGEYILQVPSEGNVMGKELAPSITFRDAFNNYWTRNATGYLKKERTNTIDRRKLDRPLHSAPIQPAEDHFRLKRNKDGRLNWDKRKE